MDRAGAARTDAAAELGARELQVLADDPEERHLGTHVDLVVLPVDIERDHKGLLFNAGEMNAFATKSLKHEESLDFFLPLRPLSTQKNIRSAGFTSREAPMHFSVP